MAKQESTAHDRIEELYDLIDDIEIAMLTTRRPDGNLVSRPMATQDRAPGADLWFVTARGAPKLEEIAHDPHVNLAYTRKGGREWVSISGTARISEDRARIRQLYRDDWKIWFADEGGSRDGGPEDPRFVLIGVHIDSAQYLTLDKPAPLAAFEFLRARASGDEPDLGEVERVDAEELRRHGAT